MNTYYTAKDIEELAANGTQQLVLGPGVFLTDFARETALYLGVELVRSETQLPTSLPPASQSNPPILSDRYNKPPGCQHGLGSLPAERSQTEASTHQPQNGSNSNAVNQLIDLMGKVIKRGK